MRCPAPHCENPGTLTARGRGEGTGTGKISHLPKATSWELKARALDLASDWRPCCRRVPLRVWTRSALDTHHPTNALTNSAQRALILQKGKLSPQGLFSACGSPCSDPGLTQPGLHPHRQQGAPAEAPPCPGLASAPGRWCRSGSPGGACAASGRRCCPSAGPAGSAGWCWSSGQPRGSSPGGPRASPAPGGGRAAPGRSPAARSPAARAPGGSRWRRCALWPPTS